MNFRNKILVTDWVTNWMISIRNQQEIEWFGGLLLSVESISSIIFYVCCFAEIKFSFSGSPVQSAVDLFEK